MESNKPFSSSFSNDSYLGSLIFYAFIALIFFYIGRNYDMMVNRLKEKG